MDFQINQRCVHWTRNKLSILSNLITNWWWNYFQLFAKSQLDAWIDEQLWIDNKQRNWIVDINSNLFFAKQIPLSLFLNCLSWHSKNDGFFFLEFDPDYFEYISWKEDYVMVSAIFFKQKFACEIALIWIKEIEITWKFFRFHSYFSRQNCYRDFYLHRKKVKNAIKKQHDSSALFYCNSKHFKDFVFLPNWTEHGRIESQNMVQINEFYLISYIMLFFVQRANYERFCWNI